jgi:hypothetical protein
MMRTDRSRVVSLQATADIFKEAWQGKLVRLPSDLRVGATDILVLREVGPGGEVLRGREVQGRSSVAGGFQPVVRWVASSPGVVDAT